MIKHDLIKEIGIEKAKAIVEGAPEEASHTNLTPNYFKNIRYKDCEMWNPYDQNWFETDVFSFDVFISINDLRTAIAEHDEDHCNHEWNDMTSNGDKYRSLVCKNCDSTKNYLPLDEDHYTDITNHISPNTKVVGV